MPRPGLAEARRPQRRAPPFVEGVASIELARVLDRLADGRRGPARDDRNAEGRAPFHVEPNAGIAGDRFRRARADAPEGRRRSIEQFLGDLAGRQAAGAVPPPARPRCCCATSSGGAALLVEVDTMTIGASVTVTAKGRMLTRPLLAGRGYLGSSDRRLHFGPGAAATADLTVRWPGGATRTVRGVETGQVLRLERPR